MWLKWSPMKSFSVLRNSFVVLLLMKVIYLMISLLIGLIADTKLFWQQSIEVLIFFGYGLFLNTIGIEATFDSFRWNPKAFLASQVSPDLYLNYFLIWSTLFFGKSLRRLWYLYLTFLFLQLFDCWWLCLLLPGSRRSRKKNEDSMFEIGFVLGKNKLLYIV